MTKNEKHSAKTQTDACGTLKNVPYSIIADFNKHHTHSFSSTDVVYQIY